ncbi:hypothetical protein BRADI_4g39335v3 [Brachypodium distachyon]|uniref:B30.2/SPRY domain-containing protein n=1 Tax=Brachypodium distachyon TaxID=15368 RepID=A0A0Q3EW52_BRADI|nr:hypothetical protein BRADI_4g39335v3 [Brachypodium distachyon]
MSIERTWAGDDPLKRPLPLYRPRLRRFPRDQKRKVAIASGAAFSYKSPDAIQHSNPRSHHTFKPQTLDPPPPLSPDPDPAARAPWPTALPAPPPPRCSRRPIPPRSSPTPLLLLPPPPPRCSCRPIPPRSSPTLLLRLPPPPPTDSSAPECNFPRPPTIHRYTTKRSRKGGRKPKQQQGAGSSSNNPNAGAGAEEDMFHLDPVKPGLLEDDTPDLPILLSLFHKDRKIALSDDRLTAGSAKGYSMVRATRGVASGAWYFEVRVLHLGPTGGDRLGWATDKALLVAPVGNDAFSFGYRSVDGSKVAKAWRSDYGDGYEAGDVLGFYISLPEGEVYLPPKEAEMVKLKGVYFFAKPAKVDETKPVPVPVPVPGSEIVYFKNGVCQGTAFDNILGGRYYPAASMYTMPDEPNCEVKFNFGPDFTFFPEDFGGRPVPRPMSEVPYQPYVLMKEGSASAEKAA